MVSPWRKYNELTSRKKQTLHSICVGFAFFAILCILTKKFDVIVCLSRRFLGIECMGCGMTRGFIEIIHLNFGRAFELNPLSIPLFFAIALYCFVFAMDLVFDRNCLEKIEKYMMKKHMLVLYFALLIFAASIKYNLIK